MKKVKAIWISYDLGIKGDFPNLYTWLDNKGAKEAGNSVAFLNYEFEGEDPLVCLKKELEENIKFNKGDRVYVIRMRFDAGRYKISGKYIIGNRKASPWEGYGSSMDEIDEGDE